MIYRASEKPYGTVSLHHFGNALRRRFTPGYEALPSEPTSPAAAEELTDNAAKPTHVMPADAIRLSPPPSVTPVSVPSLFFERLRGREYAFAAVSPHAKKGDRICYPLLDILLSDTGAEYFETEGNDRAAHAWYSATSGSFRVSLLRAPGGGLTIHAYAIFEVKNKKFIDTLLSSSYKDVKRVVQGIVSLAEARTEVWDEAQQKLVSPQFTEIVTYNDDLVASERIHRERAEAEHRHNKEAGRIYQEKMDAINEAHRKKLALKNAGKPEAAPQTQPRA